MHHDHGAHLDLWPVPPLAAALVYLVATTRAGPRGWSRWRTAAWVGGCLTVAAALSPLVPGHMARHLLLGMFAPLGLVLGAPVTLLLRVCGRGPRRVVAAVLRSPVVHVLGHPVTAAVLSVGGTYVVLLAGWPAHPLVYAHFLAAGYLFTWSVAGPDPAPRRPGLAVRVVALVLAAAAHAVLAKHLYAVATTDAERSAALLMYYGGDAAELLLAVALFAAWYRRARNGAKPRRANRYRLGTTST